ncbi:MAG: NAD-glutamate dehydrogenase domain-containing protein [Thiofilum sp.]|uniref:NAD-glutamate dehydrogenase domain-containing protein n=1 Tax=Thiofilum sp. TaxID=2212733 RepID=UPI0025CEF282|nr:NAD-glutamate dehydrogenase domain-containing protein [Thiofilum sp.]MBK8454581.1 NAD-glutamate dehydrogenase [Thiofilum sp.]
MDSNSILSAIEVQLYTQQAQTQARLAWLQQALHPFFFNFNRDETDALAVLAMNLGRLNTLHKLPLVDREDRIMLAQVSYPNSLYDTLGQLPKRNNLSYTEINTSQINLPNSYHPLEILRFDYVRKTDYEIAQGSFSTIPADIQEAVLNSLESSHSTLSAEEAKVLLQLLWSNNEQYVLVSHPERLARIIDLYVKTRANDDIYFDALPFDQGTTGETTRILFGVGNPPPNDYLLQIMAVFKRLNIGVKRAYNLTLSNGIYPYFLATFYVASREGKSLEKGSDLYKNLQRELYNTQIISILASTYTTMVESGIINGINATFVEAMISFCHTNLAHNRPDKYTPDTIAHAFHNHPDITLQLIKLFYARFDPEGTEREATYSQLLAETTDLVNTFNTGRRFLDELRRTVFRCAISFTQYCLKTNFFVPEKHALAFRLHPAYLEELGAEFTSDLPNDRPFRITFFFGRRGSGYHIGFSDIARGGWRTLITQGRDDYLNSANTLFRENYVLAHTQHLKNKDIYEGGSKMVAILNADIGADADKKRQQLYKLQFGFTNAFLDIFVTENGRAKDPRVVDYYGEDEPIELGPDENMHDAMIELIAQQARKRGYLLGAGIMSSKRVGINHKEYGVTSIGVIRFAEVTMQETLGINMHQDRFSVKFTGGPNGDVAGNGMRLLLERCPQVEIRLIIDGSGALYDPQGLDHTALAAIVLKADADAFDANALHVGGFILYRQQTRKEGLRELFKKLIKTEQGLQEEWVSNDEFYKTFNNLIFTVETDLFIPAGGRPETIDSRNVEQFFKNAQPVSKVIIEGANSFITPDARLVLQSRGVVIMRDASANKCGVISSSYEIIANLLMSDEEFLANKAQYVGDVLVILNQLAEKEARLILKRNRETGEPYTTISDKISREINGHYAKIFAYLQKKPDLVNQPDYIQAILQHLPRMIASDPFWKQRVEKLPSKLKFAILASKLASQLVYEGNDDSVYADMIASQVQHLNQLA